MKEDVRSLADTIIKCAYEKKGTDVALMDMSEITDLCDYFIIISGSSRPHTKAIAEHIDVTLKKIPGVSKKRIQGMQNGSWILIDYGDIVVHIFLESIRSFYELEKLWKKAGVEYPQAEPAK
jgi:ribosome-associated protein